MKELYLANMWPQIITKRGVQLIEASGYEVSGNWLNSRLDFSHAQNIILPYANFGKPLPIPEKNSDVWKRVASYILFPDSMVGWNHKSNVYLLRPDPVAQSVLENSTQRFSQSQFSTDLIAGVYGYSDERVIPLGVDTNSIKESVDNAPHKNLRVLWNHMWRKDKGTLEAFSIIKKLAQIHPEVEFWIGQQNTWDAGPDAQDFIDNCVPTLKILQNMPNVEFFDRIKDQRAYWAWVSHADIAFSTAFHEGFGLSMLEQEAAGVACIVPNTEAYPEIHAGCMVVERKEIEKGLETLVSNSDVRKYVAQSCVENSTKYDTSVWVGNLLKNLR